MKHYIIRLKDTELWVDTGQTFRHSDWVYYAILRADPLTVTRHAKYEEAEKFAAEHIPEGHWVIHRLTPMTEVTQKPPEETFVISDSLEGIRHADPEPVPVKVVEVDKGILAKLTRWI